MSFQVLLYHGLYRNASEIIGKPLHEHVWRDDFRRQVQWLKENGYTICSLSKCRELSDAGALPERSLCLTFDDGKESDLQLALPVLLEANVQATFFITPAWLEHTEIMSGRQVRELAESGMEIGSHSMTHPFLTEVSDSDLQQETGGSRAFLEDLIGRKVESFSYPFGDVDSRVRAATARAGYRLGCGTRRGRNRSSPDWLLLRRWAVSGSAGLEGMLRVLARRNPGWKESAAETLQQVLGVRRYTAWRGFLARRGRP